ncbi:MAG: hypothetical protein HY823_14200 [Acidobacteria bacterium]|nr:hypothetical protein [Acidobacteriota bacterium]
MPRKLVPRTLALTLLLGLAVGWVRAQVTPPPCLPPSQEACRPCHPSGPSPLQGSRALRPCSPYCRSCHFKDQTGQHHPIGVNLRKPPGDSRLLVPAGRLECATCHDLGTPRRDRGRWKSESLFDRWFRRQKDYPTYFLALRNDRGQLCLACH